MQLHELKSPAGSRKRKRIVGRGDASGLGKTSGRGNNGQKSRAGRGVLGSSEGGQMALIRRLPKVGFHSHRPIYYQVVKVSDLARFEKGTVVDAKILKEAGIIKNLFKPFKVLGNGDLKIGLTVKATAFSKSAEEKIKQAGGKTETFDLRELKEQPVTK